MITQFAVVLASTVRLADDANPDEMKSTIDNALPIAGLFVVVLGFAMWLLWKSMSKQFTKINPDLPDGPDDRERAMDRRLTEEAIERGKAEAAADRTDDAPGQ
jgi:hypothetical protein